MKNSMLSLVFCLLSMTALLKFKQSVAKQLSKHTPCQPLDLLTFMRPAKSLKDGHISIAIPKLNASLQDPMPKQNLTAWTKDLANKFELNSLIESAIAQNMLLTFKFKESEYAKQVLQQVYNHGNNYGWSHISKPNKEDETVLIDYSSPNIAKPFHAGHLRSTIIGNFTRIIHEAFGYKVIGINYLGDWGKQYGLLAIGFELYGDEKQLELDPIHHLYDVYVKINTEAKLNPQIDKQANEYFKKMELGDEKAIQQWKRFRDMSIKSYASIYKRLNVEFDVYSGESQVNDYISKVYQTLESQNLTETTSDGVISIDLEDYNLDKAIIKREDGTSLYVTRDLASILMRKEKYQFNKSIYVVGSEQANYFKQLFQISKLITKTNERLQHVDFGRIKGMSTRKGTVVFLQDILDTAKERILEYMMKDEAKSKIKNLDILADQLGVSAILIQDMKSKRCKDYEFSWDRMTDAKGDTGVFLQYAHARAYSIENKSKINITPTIDYSLLKEDAAKDLIQLISQFPDVVENSFSSLEPCTLVNYLFKLSHSISTASAFLRVKDMDPSLSEARMLLFWSARTTLGNGLRLLGIQPINKM